MTVPNIPPLMLASEYVLLTNENGGVLTGIDTGELARLRLLLQMATSYFSVTTRRRFDERLETRKSTSLDERIGGDLLGTWDYQLDDDLTNAITVTNGDGIVLVNAATPPPPPQYTLVHPNLRGGMNNIIYTAVHINIYSGVFWRSGGNDPYNSISVFGTWGYGGQWIPVGITVASDSGSTMTFSDATQLEPGMVLKLTNTSVTPNTWEYIYVDVVPTTSGGNVTVGRGYNGSNLTGYQQTWSSGTAVYRWQPLDMVRDKIAQMVQWRIEQIKSPGSGGIVSVGEYQFPTDFSGMPKSFYLGLRDAGLLRAGQNRGV